jgi:hypothetical protein
LRAAHVKRKLQIITINTADPFPASLIQAAEKGELVVAAIIDIAGHASGKSSTTFHYGSISFGFVGSYLQEHRSV